MNCHYSAQGDYKCTKPKQAAKQTTKPVATTQPPAKFTNVYFADPELDGQPDLEGEERFGNDYPDLDGQPDL